MGAPNPRRLFVAMEVMAPWPETLPEGRLIEEKQRHLTLAFLGDVDFDLLFSYLKDFPHPDFKIGLVGQFDRPLFLPRQHPRGVAWNVSWLEENNLLSYVETLTHWSRHLGLSLKTQETFHPHVTIARTPFDAASWEENFSPLPLCATHIHIMESLPFSQYRSLFTLPLLLPFEEIEHTADIGYLIRGRNLSALYTHAKVALAFSFPPLLPYILKLNPSFEGIEDVVIALNQIVTIADSQVGCPFKAVSFHGALKTENILQWEMIIDV